MRAFAAWCLSLPRLLLDLRRVLRDERIDLIHLHYAAPYQYVFRLIRLLFGIPYILTLHRGDIMTIPTLQYLDKRLVRYAMDGTSKVVSVSHWLANRSMEAIGEVPNLEVIPNGLDLVSLDGIDDVDVGAKIGFEIPARFFLIVSNVAHYKAQDVAIRAWAQVRRQCPGVPLLIVGDKRELWDECVRLVRELDCDDAITFLGPQPRTIAISLMRRAAAILVPSRSEGLPYVLLEAGALAKPVICSNIGPFTEVVEDGKTGLVTPVEEDKAIAAASIRLLSDPDFGRKIGTNLMNRIKSDFSAERMANQYLSIYAAICHAKDKSSR